MASLFESFVHPFTILLTVPLSLFGVAVTFSLSGITLNTTSYLGLLTLFGIVVNNGIILIDHIRTLRKSGMEKDAAIVQGGKDRMRPIIMTAITTIFGVLPLALPFLLPQLFRSRRTQSPDVGAHLRGHHRRADHIHFFHSDLFADLLLDLRLDDGYC